MERIAIAIVHTTANTSAMIMMEKEEGTVDQIAIDRSEEPHTLGLGPQQGPILLGGECALLL